MLKIRKLGNGWKNVDEFIIIDESRFIKQKCRVKTVKVRTFLITPSIKHSKFDTINKLPFLSIDCNLDKCQLISKCPFSVIVSTKMPTIFLRISALGSKKR